VVYTNKPTPGAFRGYGAMQCLFGIEALTSEIAERMGWDVVEFKMRNVIKEGEALRIAKALGEGREGFEQEIRSSGLARCVEAGMAAMDWHAKQEEIRRHPRRTAPSGGASGWRSCYTAAASPDWTWPRRRSR
jgi:putative selenate reductase molybdopterin-binding subunit